MKRYAVKAKRKNFNQPWSAWTLVDNYKRATEHAQKVENLGYLANIEIKEPGIEDIWNILGNSAEAREKTDAILDLGFRKQDVVINEFVAELETEIAKVIEENTKLLPEVELSDTLYHEIKGKITGLRYIEDFVAGLKKKYEVTEETEETEEKYFTPEEVQKMSRSEVRDNYKAIMDSMKKWN